jgi:hypothetical protein
MAQQQEQVPQADERIVRSLYYAGAVESGMTRPRVSRLVAAIRKEVLGEVREALEAEIKYLGGCRSESDRLRTEHPGFADLETGRIGAFDHAIGRLIDLLATLQPSTLDHDREGVTQKDIDRGVELDQELGWSEGSRVAEEACEREYTPATRYWRDAIRRAAEEFETRAAANFDDLRKRERGSDRVRGLIEGEGEGFARAANTLRELRPDQGLEGADCAPQVDEAESSECREKAAAEAISAHVAAEDADQQEDFCRSVARDALRAADEAAYPPSHFAHRFSEPEPNASLSKPTTGETPEAGPKTFAELRDRFVDPEKEQLRAELAKFREERQHVDTTLNGDGTMTCDLCGFTEPDQFHAGAHSSTESKEER